MCHFNTIILLLASAVSCLAGDLSLSISEWDLAGGVATRVQVADQKITVTTLNDYNQRNQTLVVVELNTKDWKNLSDVTQNCISDAMFGQSRSAMSLDGTRFDFEYLKNPGEKPKSFQLQNVRFNELDAMMALIDSYLPDKYRLGYTGSSEAVPILEGKRDTVTEAANPTNKKGEQPGADQPATKPADKDPVKDQPSTPTSKDGPR